MLNQNARDFLFQCILNLKNNSTLIVLFYLYVYTDQRDIPLIPFKEY